LGGGISYRFERVALLHADGNLVIPDEGAAVRWESGTAGNPESVLILRDDGILVIQAPDGTVVWRAPSA